jgi:uncharacterized protein
VTAPSPARIITIYVDADACPVKQEVYRVAERHGLKVFVVSNTPIAVPRDPLIERVVVAAGMDAADDWIAERSAEGAIVVTQDIPLAARVVKAGGIAIAPNGKPFSESSIGRGDHRRAEAVFAERQIGVSAEPGARDRQAQAQWIRR